MEIKRAPARAATDGRFVRKVAVHINSQKVVPVRQFGLDQVYMTPKRYFSEI